MSKKPPKMYLVLRDILDRKMIPHFLIVDEITDLWSITLVKGVEYPKEITEEMIKVCRCTIKTDTIHQGTTMASLEKL